MLPAEPGGEPDPWSDALTFTPADWRRLLEDPSFLSIGGTATGSRVAWPVFRSDSCPITT